MRHQKVCRESLTALKLGDIRKLRIYDRKRESWVPVLALLSLACGACSQPLKPCAPWFHFEQSREDVSCVCVVDCCSDGGNDDDCWVTITLVVRSPCVKYCYKDHAWIISFNPHSNSVRISLLLAPHFLVMKLRHTEVMQLIIGGWAGF